MEYTLFSATGCARCKIVMRCMDEQGIAYEEYDFKAEGKNVFQQFYAANRSSVYRGPAGIEFPILTDGQVIKQGIGPALAWLKNGKALDGFFRIGVMRKEWIDGISVSSGDSNQGAAFLDVLRCLKKNAMKLVIETNGKNAAILESVMSEKLADKVIMHVLGPLSLYEVLAGERIEPQEIEQSLAAVARGCDYQFQTEVAPVRRQSGEYSYLTPGEIGETARLIEMATSSKKQPYLVKLFQTKANSAGTLPEPLTAQQLFPYRSAARAFQVMTEIEKDSPI